MAIASIITTYNRPHFLRECILPIAHLGAPLLVVDDGSDLEKTLENEDICRESRCHYLRLPANRGLAASLGIGLAYWLVDHGIEYISYFQDDVEVDEQVHDVLRHVASKSSMRDRSVFTGHDAKEHKPIQKLICDGITVLAKKSCRATHMFASRKAWSSVLPIPSKGVGYPKRTGGGVRGEGSDVDWKITETLRVQCVPGLVRTFAHLGRDSCWQNTQIAGPDAPLSRASIQGWLARTKS